MSSQDRISTNPQIQSIKSQIEEVESSFSKNLRAEEDKLRTIQKSKPFNKDQVKKQNIAIQNLREQKNKELNHLHIEIQKQQDLFKQNDQSVSIKQQESSNQFKEEENPEIQRIQRSNNIFVESISFYEQLIQYNATQFKQFVFEMNDSIEQRIQIIKELDFEKLDNQEVDLCVTIQDKENKKLEQIEQESMNEKFKLGNKIVKCQGILEKNQFKIKQIKERIKEESEETLKNFSQSSIKTSLTEAQEEQKAEEDQEINTAIHNEEYVDSPKNKSEMINKQQLNVLQSDQERKIEDIYLRLQKIENEAKEKNEQYKKELQKQKNEQELREKEFEQVYARLKYLEKARKQEQEKAYEKEVIQLRSYLIFHIYEIISLKLHCQNFDELKSKLASSGKNLDEILKEEAYKLEFTVIEWVLIARFKKSNNILQLPPAEEIVRNKEKILSKISTEINESKKAFEKAFKIFVTNASSLLKKEGKSRLN